MRLSTKGRHAVTAMIDLALRAGRGPVSVTAIGRRQDISVSYLEALLGMLRRGELVTAVRGKGGGYLLARPAEEISVADIAAAVDESVVAIGCGGKGSCMGVGTGHCMTHELWAGLDARLNECLAAMTLKDLAADQLARGVSVEQAPGPRARPSRTGAATW